MNSIMSNAFSICIYCLALGLLWNCNATSQSLTDKPTFKKVDEKFANVYKILDGTWKGEFTVLEDPNPKPVGEVELKNLTLAQVQAPHLKETNRIQVTQVYTSETPYFQTVTITDTYPETNKKEVSTGVNKIEDGKMWCIVNKPSETIIHNGKTEGDDTIIWYSNQTAPQKIEYFKETVGEQFYEIIGYGYYEGDNIDLSPRLWFYGKYARQN